MIVNAATFRAILRNIPANALRPIIEGDLSRVEVKDTTWLHAPILGTFSGTKDGNVVVKFWGDDYPLLYSLATELYNKAGDITIVQALAWIAFRSYQELFAPSKEAA
ncbi:hypothetical protein [Ralstonia phage RpY2]|uniref:Uncharacterized protein n=1 Tax=Ralstonia phage RpY2 TaxID=2880950 RepID=A0AC61TNJ7_9CAUD|nr:hypothetical protein [Ralstonia phage RpY2]